MKLLGIIALVLMFGILFLAAIKALTRRRGRTDLSAVAEAAPRRAPTFAIPAPITEGGDLDIPDLGGTAQATENQLNGLRRWGMDPGQPLTFDQASLLLSTLAYSQALFRQEAGSDEDFPAALQSPLLRFIFADEALTSYIQRWNSSRFAQAPDPDKPIRLRRNEHYERIVDKLREIANEQ